MTSPFSLYAQVCLQGRTGAEEAGARGRHLPAGVQPGHVGHQHPGDEQGRFASNPGLIQASLILACVKIPSQISRVSGQVLRWRVGVADHNARVDAAGHLLPLPLDGLPLRDLEEVFQVQDAPQRVCLTNRIAAQERALI